MNILAFDIATRTGVAFGGLGDRPLTNQIDLGQGRSDGARFAKAIHMTRGFIEARRPDLVAVECPIGPKSHQILIGLFACVVGQVHEMGVPLVRYQVAAIRKHFIGQHLTTRSFPHLSKPAAKEEIKRTVMARCAALGWPCETDDEADAVALLDYAHAKNSRYQPKPVGGLF